MAGTSTLTNDGATKDSGGRQELASMFSQLIREEMGRMLKGKQVDEQVNYANVIDYAGMASSSYMFIKYGSWILDTGASSHMSSKINLMQHITSVYPPIKIHLPDSNTKLVKKKEVRSLYILN